MEGSHLVDLAFVVFCTLFPDTVTLQGGGFAFHGGENRPGSGDSQPGEHHLSLAL